MKDGLHLGLIMDGNRRFAKRLMLEPWKGHEYGAQKLEEIFRWCQENNISELTLYAFSMQNFNRPKHELDYLMNLFRKEFKKFEEKENEINKFGLQIKFFGRIDLFPQDIQKVAKRIEDDTKNNKGYNLNFCLGYGGREEITDAIYNLAKDIKKGKITPEQIDEELIGTYLYTTSEPDLIIRTGGDHRTSNFLIWQSTYSEWFFIDEYWPELTTEKLSSLLEEFHKRDRRFGK